MNTYAKYCPNVFVAKCEEAYQKGDIIEVQTKYGKANECLVHNLVAKKDGFYYYSITREDGISSQERARRRAERLQYSAEIRHKKSDEFWEAANEGRDFLRLAEPIKVGHHSEKRHRALIERNHNRISKAVGLMDEAKTYEERAEYWEAKAGKIDLSMPESLEYFAFELEKAKMKQEGLKNGTIKREHSFSLTYATNAVKEMAKKLETAKRLWADTE